MVMMMINKDIMPHAQYRVAKKDVEHFCVLVELADNIVNIMNIERISPAYTIMGSKFM